MLNILLFLSLLLTFVSTSLSFGQVLDDGQIIEKLSKVKTRSLAPPKRPTSEQLEILRVLQSRGLSYTAETRQDINTAYELVEKYEYPRLSFAIEFAYGSAEINEQSKAQLVNLSKALKSDTFRDANFVLAGHTDAKGDDEFNLDLSRKRSKAVLMFLSRNMNVPTNTLSSVGLGETKLKNKENPFAKENRRVEIINVGASE